MAKRQIKAFQPDGKGGVKKVFIDEPDEMEAQRENRDWLNEEAKAQIEMLLSKVAELEARIEKLERT